MRRFSRVLVVAGVLVGCNAGDGNDATLGDCAPICNRRECGDDGCGGICGSGEPCNSSSDDGYPRMVRVPAGDFFYGPGGGGSETLTTESFYIDIYEVTAWDYRTCVNAGVCSYNGGWGHYHTYRESKENHPINNVNWQDAVDYCTWKGKRLPTEFEWEKAARGTDGRMYPWGDETATCNYAVMGQEGEGELGCGADSTWELGCGADSTWEVGQKPNGVSPYGAHDMAGNVWEWTSSWHSSSHTFRVFRGGSFNYHEPSLRCSHRNSHKPKGRYRNGGFRCAQ